MSDIWHFSLIVGSVVVLHLSGEVLPFFLNHVGACFTRRRLHHPMRPATLACPFELWQPSSSPRAGLPLPIIYSAGFRRDYLQLWVRSRVVEVRDHSSVQSQRMIGSGYSDRQSMKNGCKIDGKLILEFQKALGRHFDGSLGASRGCEEFWVGLLRGFWAPQSAQMLAKTPQWVPRAS